MKTLFASFVLIISAAAVFGQLKPLPAPSPMPATPVETALETAAEADEAFERFDFAELEINPNNLTGPMIADLRVNFLAAVKPAIISEGDYPKRLKRIAAPIFRLHKTDNSETVAFAHSVPMFFTWKETFIVVSTATLDALTDDEIAALLGHEIGHLYYAAALVRAREEKDDRAARVIELQCDLVALTTLSKLAIKPSKLVAAVEKLIEQRRRRGFGSFQAGSPSLENRRRVLALYSKRGSISS